VEALEKICRASEAAIELIETEVSTEIVALELQAGLKAVHEVLGKEFHEQVIDRIFKEFCLGK
jgi:tRNA modification GTPase